MATLVACLSVGKGTWQTVHDLVNSGTFDRIFLIATQYAKDNYPNTRNAEIIAIDPARQVTENITIIEYALKGKIPDLDVAVNLTSGTGVEHMAVLAALLRLGLGVRLVNPGETGIAELGF